MDQFPTPPKVCYLDKVGKDGILRSKISQSRKEVHTSAHVDSLSLLTFSRTI